MNDREPLALSLRLPRAILEWIPLMVIITFAILVSIIWFGALNDGDTFAPIEIDPVRVTNVGPVSQGGLLTVRNGIRNRAKEPISANISFGLQEAIDDPLAAKTVPIVQNLSRPIAPGSSYEDLLTGPLPPEVTPGKWQIYVQIVAMGAKASEVQRLAELSNIFEVR